MRQRSRPRDWIAEADATFWIMTLRRRLDRRGKGGAGRSGASGSMGISPPVKYTKPAEEE